MSLEYALKRTFEALAMTTATTKDCMVKMTQIQSQNEIRKSKSFKIIKQKHQNILLVASSSGEAVTSELDDKIKAIF